MPLPRFLRTGSRRSLPRGLVSALVAGLFAGMTVQAHAQFSHTQEIQVSGDYLEVSLDTSTADSESILPTLQQNLQDGLQARVEFVIRLSVPRDRPFRFLGNRPAGEYRSWIDARFDPFLNRYVLTDDTDTRYNFTEWTEMVDFLFSLRGFQVPYPSRTSQQVTVVTQVIFTPVVFVPALGILSVFMTRSRDRSEPVKTLVWNTSP